MSQELARTGAYPVTGMTDRPRWLFPKCILLAEDPPPFAGSSLSRDAFLMTRHGFALAIALLVGPSAAGTPALPAGRFELTVDSIMRGPDLVGYPPTGLRWSADSQKLFFEWRKPSETESSTYVVGRDGGEPRKLSDDEAKSAPSATGRWDKAHRRILFVDGGDVVLVDSARSTRRQITRTAPYSVEKHSFTEASSWADAYRRILKLFEDNLRTPHNGKGT